MLRLQQEWRQGEPPLYAAGPLDVMGATIWRLANGLSEPEKERSLTMEL